MVMEKIYDNDIVSVQSFLDKFCTLYSDRNFMKIKKGTVEMVYTFPQLMNDSYILAKNFIKKGYTGKHIAVLSENRYEFITTFFATLLAGGVFVPINIGEAPEKVIGMLQFADVNVAICSAKTAAFATPIKATCPAVEEIYSYDSVEGLTSFDELMAECDGDYKFHGDFADDRAVMLCFTSGTSAGLPKCVMLTANNIFAPVKHKVYRFLTFMGDNKVAAGGYSALPLFHLAALACVVVFGGIATGSTYSTSSDVRASFSDLPYFSPEYMLTVPALAEPLCAMVEGAIKQNKGEEWFAEYCRDCDNGKYTIEERREICRPYAGAFGEKLNTMTICGAKVPDELIRRVRYLGIIAGSEYGLTECSPKVTMLSPSIGFKEGSVGIICSFNEARIIDGVLYVKGDNVMKGYYKNPIATSEAMTEDGWLCTGDMAEIDDEGFVFIKGRAGNIAVLSNGENIDTEEVASYYATSPLISELIVMADAKNNNDTLGAIIYSECGASYDDIQQEILKINAKLPVNKRIARFRLIDKPFEKNSMMKIKRFIYLKEGI